MKVTVKTLQQKVFQIEAEGTDTVADLKSKILEAQGHAVESQKLIYSGKVLPDSKTVESCEIKEKDFLVLMVSKPKPTPATPAASSSTAATSSAPPAAAAEPPAAAPAAAAPQPPNAPIITPAQAAPVEAPAPAAERAFGDMGSFLSGAELQATIQNMVDMGFERQQVMRAMRASFNNPDRAVEYLFNGIPAHLERAAAGEPPAQGAPPAAAGAAPAAQPAAPAPAAAAAGQTQNLFQLAQQQQQPGGGAARGAAAAGAAGGPLGAEQLAAMAQDPQIQQLRGLVAQNPALAQAMIQELAAQNPGLAQAFAQNPAALAQLLQTGEGGEAANQQLISVSTEEMAAIERLEGLGFPRHIVVEAYFACDKNEEMAANYLFENQFDDDS